MRRGAIASATVVLLAWACAAVAGRAGMGTYLAAWLVLLAVPAGAIPLVLAAELAGLGGSRDSGALRWLLALMPAAALAGVPVLLASSVYPWAAHPAGVWFTALGFGLRGAACLAGWVALALLNLLPAPAAPRVGRCVAGLAVHAAIVTVAALDWVMSLSPHVNPAEAGLLLAAAQASIAASAAVLLARGAMPRAAGLLLGCGAVWGVLAFLQFLILWSADKPAEAAYYLQRGGALGGAAAWLMVATVAAGLAAHLLPAWRVLVPACAALLLASGAVQMFWSVTPGLRGRLVIAWADVAGLALLALAAAALAWAWQPRTVAA